MRSSPGAPQAPGLSLAGFVACLWKSELDESGAIGLKNSFLWERAYEARLHRGQEEIIERGKTPEAAQAFLTERCFAENGPAITDTEIQIEVHGDLIIVAQPATQFCAIYTKPNNQPRLILSAAPIPMTMCCLPKLGRRLTPKRANSDGPLRGVGFGRRPFSCARWRRAHIAKGAFGANSIRLVLVEPAFGQLGASAPGGSFMSGSHATVSGVRFLQWQPVATDDVFEADPGSP